MDQWPGAGGARRVPGAHLRSGQPLPTTTGTAQWQVALPNSPSVAGINLYHQMIALEFDALGNWINTTATNGLQLVVGAL